jgi:hypothetical protein
MRMTQIPSKVEFVCVVALLAATAPFSPFSRTMVARAQNAKPEDKLVYTIENAITLPFGLLNGRILLKLEGKVPLSTPPTPDEIKRLEDENNWNIRTMARTDILDKDGAVIEPKGSVNDIKPRLVRVISNEKLARVLIGKELDRTKYDVKVTFNRSVDFPETLEVSQIDVEFGDSMPKDDGPLTNPQNWLVRKTSLEDGKEERITPVSVGLDRKQRVVVLRIPTSGKLDLEKDRYVVRYNQPNFPEFTLGAPKKLGASKVFTAAKGESDADIYFSGTATGAKGSKPAYDYTVKLGYLFAPCVRCGSIGPRITVKAAGESNVDPDSIKATATYEKVFVLAPVTGIILRSDFIGAEFDTSNRTRNLSTGLDSILVIPTYPIGKNNFFTIDFLTGFEGGHNYRHKLNEKGLGNFWRWKFGSKAYFTSLNVLGLKRINVSGEYAVRLLHSFEPFTETIDGEEVTSLRKKPRHNVATNIDFMFSDALGVTLKYQFGSLPPAFNFVNHTVSIGLTFQLKQANR